MSKDELQKKLKQVGWGAKDLAFRLGLNVRTVQRWLSGSRRIPVWLSHVMIVQDRYFHHRQKTFIIDKLKDNG